MKIVLQRVKEASVSVNGQEVGKIKQGLLLLIGISPTDQASDLPRIASKIVNMRIFEDEAGKFQFSALDLNAQILAVSQFTLLASYQKGRRPDFSQAAAPDQASKLYQLFIAELKKYPLKIESGIFGAHMQVTLINDGPVTLVIDAQEL